MERRSLRACSPVEAECQASGPARLRSRALARVILMVWVALTLEAAPADGKARRQCAKAPAALGDACAASNSDALDA